MEQHYQDKIDSIFGNYWKHRTLRTCFDPASSEWQDTSIEKKIEILRKLVESGEPLEYWIDGYTHFYEEELSSKGYVVKTLPDALKILLNTTLKEKL